MTLADWPRADVLLELVVPLNGALDGDSTVGRARWPVLIVELQPYQNVLEGTPAGTTRGSGHNIDLI